MIENAKIIQDLSILYELSLAVGNSLDVEENALHFFRTLLRRKNLNYASLWMYEPEKEVYELRAAYPDFRSLVDVIPADHPLTRYKPEEAIFVITDEDPAFSHFVQESQINGGGYLVYRLQDLGFVKLYVKNRPEGISAKEMSQLEQVMDKFRVSLNGCLAFDRYQQESARRLVAQQAAERSNKLLRESETKVRKIIDSSLDGVITIDEHGKVTEWSTQTEQIFGYDREEVLGELLSDLIIPPRYRQAHERGMTHFLNTGEGPVLNKLIELVGVHKKGHEFPIELSITAIQQDDSYFFSSFVRDITERKKIENALRQSEEKYRGIIENMELGLLEVDAEGKVVRAFDRFCEMTGYSNEDLIGRQAEEVLLPIEYQDFLRQQNEDRRSGLANIYEVELVKKDGTRIWVLISGAPIYDSDGEMSGSLGIHYDITHRKRLEQDLQHARQVAEQARAAEQQFLANMSHEIRTPMNTVIGMTHLLYETSPNNLQKEYLHALRFSADSLLGIIDNILDMSKIEAGKLEFEAKAFNLQEMLRSLQRTFQFRVREKPISVDIEVDPAITNLVEGDPTRLNQVLTNLLGNASKFTEKGIVGVIVRLLAETENSYALQFIVHDTGIGIPAEKLDLIFENFKQANVNTTRKYGGTGLGLAIVKELVELQGGTIYAESEPDKGSRFIINITLGNTGTLVTEKLLDTEDIEAQRKNALSDIYILVVEDNPMNQKLVKQILRLWGTRYAVVDNGVQAVEITRQETFDVILMDVHMPELDGFGATRAIRADDSNLNQNTPIIALTAAALVSEKEEAFRSGMNEFLTKPFSPKSLENAILGLMPVTVEEITEEVPAEEDYKPLINLTYLEEFSGGDPIFIRDMIETFLSQTPDSLEVINEAAAQENWEEVYKQVHRLKPNLMMLGLEDLRMKSAELERQIKQADFDADQLRAELLELTQRTSLSFEPLQRELEQW